MANQEQLAILKQGVEVWNKWREENPDTKVDLSGADLKGFYLFDAYLHEAELGGVDLTAADLRSASLARSNLREVNLHRADLHNANLYKADLRKAELKRAYLGGATLIEADLSSAILWDTNLNEAKLKHANLKEAIVGGTNFGSTDLSKTFGLEDVIHDSPSPIATDTIRLSKGKIPEVFLRGCGLSDFEIESSKLYNPDLNNDEIIKIQYHIYDLRATQALQISPLFISYSHANTSFVDQLDKALTEKGVRFWRDIHDAIAGRLETQIDRAIRKNPTVLLVLSKNSITSDWVEHEVRTARSLEKEMGRDVLCPVALDDSWKNSPWSKRIMEQVMEYNILDFSAWKDDSKFGDTFNKLIDGLGLFYK